MKNGNESASTIVLAMMTLMILSVCAAMALRYTHTIARNTQRTHSLQEAISAGTGALDLAFVQWRAACREQENSALPSKEIKKRLKRPNYPEMEAKEHRFLKNMPSGQPFKVGTYKIDAINATDPKMNALPEDKAPIPSQAQSLGCSTMNYLASVEVPYETPNGANTAHVYRVFQKVTISPWQYAIFYNDDLEMNPAALEHITGWVHTNGSLFTGGHNGNNFLHFMSKVSCAKSWKVGWKETDTSRGGDTPASPAYLSPPQSGAAAQIPMNSEALLEGSQVNNPNLAHGLHEMIERPRNSNSYVDPLQQNGSEDASPRFYYHAGVRLLVEKGQGNQRVLKIYNKQDQEVTAESKSAVDRAIYETFSKAVNLDNTIADNREKSTLKLAQLDINQIQSALDRGGALADIDFHTIYIADTTATDNIETPLSKAVRGAVELVNGYKMPDLGLTVVSENPVYIRGDYNTANSHADAVPSNSGNFDAPEEGIHQAPHAEGYTPQPCAVIADAVTVLSNAWGTNPKQNYSTYADQISPAASHTTVNTAILAGIVTSGLKKESNGRTSTNGVTYSYSGGAETFPRFLEDWSGGKSLTYYGSMVQLYTSRQAVGVWRGCTAKTYKPMRRQWYFDRQFLTKSPPSTLQLVSYAKSRWFTKTPAAGMSAVQE